MACVDVKQFLRLCSPCICSLCHLWVSVCVSVLFEGRAQAGRCIFTTGPRCLEQKLCCRKIMWLCEFHPCHVIRAQGRVWEVLSRSVRLLLARETGSEGDGRRWRQSGGGWMQGGLVKKKKADAGSVWKQEEKDVGRAFWMWSTPRVSCPPLAFLSLWILVVAEEQC